MRPAAQATSRRSRSPSCAVCCATSSVKALPLDQSQLYLSKLAVDIGQHDDFHDKRVMDVSFNYVREELRPRFLVLQFFPEQFMLEDAAALWDVAEDRPRRCSASSKVQPREHQHTAAGLPTFLVLDHIWVFANRRAEDVGWRAKQGLVALSCFRKMVGAHREGAQ